MERTKKQIALEWLEQGIEHGGVTREYGGLRYLTWNPEHADLFCQMVKDAGGKITFDEGHDQTEYESALYMIEASVEELN